MTRLRPSLTDLALTAGLAVCLLIGSNIAASRQLTPSRQLDVLAFVLLVLAAVTSLLFRRTAALWGLAATMVVVSGYLLAGYPYGPIQVCMIIAMFEVARQSPLRTSMPACALAAVVASATVLPRLSPHLETPLLFAAAWTGWIVLPWSLGALVHVITAARERARNDLISRVVLEERMKIAGEVHDVAGHGFAVVAMQAGVALLVFDEQPDQARASLRAIQDTSNKSLAELRGMLDTVHPGQVTDAGLGELDALLAQVRAGGLQVDLERGPVDSLPEEVDAVAYRIIQESLTNVLRHAEANRARVEIVQQDDELRLRVSDAGRGRTEPGEGRGLTGMRSRVESIGGSFEAGPLDGGGFLVTARLPRHGGRR